MKKNTLNTSFRLERKRNGEISTIACLQAIVFLKEILKELEISFLLNLKIKLITVRFFDFCNLCIYDTFTFVYNKSVRSLRFIRFTNFGRDDVYGERFVLMLNVNSK